MKQGQVVRRATVSILTWCVAAWGSYRVWPAPGDKGVADRLAYAARWLVAPSGMLLLMIVVVAYHRFLSHAIDPMNADETPAFRVNCRVLSNTVEQLIVFAVPCLALASLLEGDALKLVPVLCVLFCVGRGIFWLAYLKEPMLRSYGLSWTLVPSTLMTLYVLWRLVF